jgi:hypothetical protein
MRLNELSEKLGYLLPAVSLSNLSNEEKIVLLQRWLVNIQKRRTG